MNGSRASAVATCLLALSAVGAAHAAQPLSGGDLEAVVHSLQFVETLPRSGEIVFAIVYSLDGVTGKAAAEQAAKALAALPGPNTTSFQPEVMSADALDGFQGHLDAILLMPGASARSATIVKAVRTRRAISISNDPDCLVQSCCVLMVRSGTRVEIVLDTTLADAAGARFSTVFTMMVKRK